MAKKKELPKKLEDKVDLIIRHLQRMDRRDRLRTWGGFFRSLIGFIPIIIFVFAAWYMYMYGDQLLEKIAQQAAKQAAEITQQNAEVLLQKTQGDSADLMKQLQGLFGG